VGVIPCCFRWCIVVDATTLPAISKHLAYVYPQGDSPTVVSSRCRVEGGIVRGSGFALVRGRGRVGV